MPNVYVRKSSKGSWSQEDLQQAIGVIENGLSIRSAGKQFKIPESTLRNRLKKNSFEKKGMGPEAQLGIDAENKLSLHIKKLQAVGFAPTQRDVRHLAFNLATSLNKKHTFNTETKTAGKVWFSSFMRRHPELSVRKAQGISKARTEGMNRAEIKNYFTLLTDILTENDLLDKPACIWNCDEIGVQLNNEPGKVIAAKGSKDVHVVTSAEKGETITVLACCSAEGQFLPPYCIFNGVYAKSQHLKSAPPGTVIKMNKKSAYITTELFMDWMTQHFIPRKPTGKNLLVLDGHASHMNSADMLQIASDNDIIIVCLPSHTTHYLQPLDRVVFKPFKTYFKDACAKMVSTRRGTGKITRDDFGELLNSAWSRSATVQLATSSFRATGIYPLNMDAIPEHAYLLSCDQDAPVTPGIGTPDPISATDQTPVTPPSAISSEVSFLDEVNSQPSTSKARSPVKTSKGNSQPFSKTSPQSKMATSPKSKITPNKALATISPIPASLGQSKVKRKISATNVLLLNTFLANKKKFKKR
ncbi:tigger transposable element-derived protein 1-like [Photinus pyralis]|uniref:tigger transposable element-derived protein 1-like n=1 Tax=Photinus pyralis TaxID=7054 RepID=UPI001266E680|nr:tigger transposable element-derived protein 1-like [Photinus pyralis]